MIHTGAVSGGGGTGFTQRGRSNLEADNVALLLLLLPEVQWNAERALRLLTTDWQDCLTLANRTANTAPIPGIRLRGGAGRVGGTGSGPLSFAFATNDNNDAPSALALSLSVTRPLATETRIGALAQSSWVAWLC